MAGVKKTRTDRNNEIEQFRSEMENATVAVVTDYRGLSVAELTELRRELYKHQARYTVTKNTLMRHAVAGSPSEAIASLMKGPSAIVFGRADQVQPIKVLREFYKKNKKENEIRGGFMDGKLLSSGDVDQLATLPSLDELRGKLLGCIASPLNGIVSAISSPQRSLVNVLDQYAKQQQQ